MKHMKLMALVALGVMVQPTYARNESSGWIKKTAYVSWHGVQVVAGVVFLNKWHTMTGSKCDPRSKSYGFDCERGPFIVAGATLLWHGVRGLDKELHIWKQFKKK